MISTLKRHARVIALGVVGAVAAFFVFGGFWRGRKFGGPYDAVPRDSFLVATVNLAELRRSPLYDVLFGKDAKGAGPSEKPMLNARALGMGKLADACGFDPLSRVEDLAIAVPEEGDKGEFGVAARVTVTRDELSTCTTRLAEQRGGKVETKDVGSFTVLEDASSIEAARPRLAYGHGGLLVVGRGAWFDAMLAAADGKRPGAREAQAHVAMRSSLTSRDGWRAPTLLVSAVLPQSLRNRIKSEMGAEIGSKDDSQNVMGGVLGVSTVGLALRAGESGQSIDGAIELVCDTEEACAAVEKLILKKRLDWSKELTLRMVGLGPLLDSIQVARPESSGGAPGPRIRVTAGAAADTLASTIERVLRLTSHSRGRADAVPTPSTDEPKPDEKLPAPPPSR
ncbi:MAG TPA: hypothetical protein VM580_15695 [Labilithrix sp.]|nr:hypothetical protein [Labilithrix sp.]